MQMSLKAVVGGIRWSAATEWRAHPHVGMADVPELERIMARAHANRILPSAIVALLFFLAPSATHAQDHLASLLLDLIARSSVNATDTTSGIAHQPHFLPGLALKLTPRELNKALGSQLATFPLPSSSGGFAYTVDEATGEIRPITATFGPAFGERALTIGRRRLDFGLTFRSTGFDSFEGAELTGGNIKFYLEHNNCCPAGNQAPTQPTDFNPEFERDLLESAISMEIDSNTTAFFANYGVTDRFDMGIAVPIVHVQLRGEVTSTIVRTATGNNTRIHSFDGQGRTANTVGETMSATGLGDILLRAKYNFFRRDANAIAAAVDLRLPTGNEDDLLGTGATQTKLLFVASGERGVVSSHVNFGYTFSNGEVSDLTSTIPIDPTLPGAPTVSGLQQLPFDPSVPDEFNYTFGASVAAHPRVTLGFDFVGRTILDVFRFQVGDRTFPNRAPGTVPTAAFAATGEFLVRGDQETGTRQNLNLLLGSIAGKINIGRSLLLNAGLVFPLNDSGLEPKVTPFLGFDYLF
jgi:hypothetical protein